MRKLLLVFMLLDFTGLIKAAIVTVNFTANDLSGGQAGANRINLIMLPSKKIENLKSGGTTTISTTDTSFTIWDTELANGSYAAAACSVNPQALISESEADFTLNINHYAKKLCDFCEGLTSDPTVDAKDLSYILCQEMMPKHCCQYIVLSVLPLKAGH